MSGEVTTGGAEEGGGGGGELSFVDSVAADSAGEETTRRRKIPNLTLLHAEEAGAMQPKLGTCSSLGKELNWLLERWR